MPEPEVFAIDCPDCEHAVPAALVAGYPVSDDDEWPDVRRYGLLRCPECRKPFLVLLQGEVVDRFGHDLTRWQPRVVMFPASGARLDDSVPTSIARSYREAWSCFRAGASTASAIMCRRTVEALCEHHNTGRNNLARSLDALRERGVIEARLFAWADALRLAGNDAAHDVSAEVSREDARDLLEFTRGLLEYVFTFADTFEKFQRRRAARTMGHSQAGQPDGS